MRQTPSTASFASTTNSSRGPPHSQSHSNDTLVFRNLNFGASIPLQIVIKNEELPSNSDRTIGSYYIQAPRITYLPLLLPTIRKQFLNLVLDQQTRDELKDDEIWFEAEGEQGGGVPLKWHWPLGVLYDYHHALSHPSIFSTIPPASPESESDPPSSLESVFLPFNPSFSLSTPSSRSPLSLPSNPTRDSQSTLRATTTSRSSSRSVSSTSTSPLPQPPSQTPSILPWKLTLHLSGTPPQEVLLMKPGLVECKQQYMNRLKESDHVRFGGSKKKLNSLRKEEQDSLWDGIITGNFDLFWSIASKLIPSPPPPPSPITMDNTSTYSLALPPSTPSIPQSDLKNVPIRTILSGDSGGRTYSIPISPYSLTGQPTTIDSYLSTLFPLLFPPGKEKKREGVYCLVQGVRVPLESEVGWLGSCMTGGDGWVWVVVGIDEGS